jgi:hypothetical protein
MQLVAFFEYLGYKRGILKGQTMQWPKEKGQQEKQRSTKHYTEN